jgi:hypothetical protein
MFGGATQYANLYGDKNRHDSETVSGFRRGAVRATLLSGAVRTSDLLTGVSAASTAAAVRGRAQRLRRAILKDRTAAVAGWAMMSEWRRQVGLDFGSMRMSLGGAPPLCHRAFDVPARLAGWPR